MFTIVYLHIVSSLEIRFTFDSVINCVANNNYIKNKNEEKSHHKEINKEKIKKEEKKELSKLATVLYDICFGRNISNIKFRFIGNVRPVEGYYKSLRDVLLFLFDCSKIMKKILNSKKSLPESVYIYSSDNFLEKILYEINPKTNFLS